MQVNAEAFNLFNHQIVTGVNGTYTSYLALGKPGCQTITPPSGSQQRGCFIPYTGTGSSAFGATSSTSSSNLYGSRQMQFSAKLFF